jgi:hypothetical protein
MVPRHFRMGQPRAVALREGGHTDIGLHSDLPISA